MRYSTEYVSDDYLHMNSCFVKVVSIFSVPQIKYFGCSGKESNP